MGTREGGPTRPRVSVGDSRSYDAATRTRGRAAGTRPRGARRVAPSRIGTSRAGWRAEMLPPREPDDACGATRAADDAADDIASIDHISPPVRVHRDASCGAECARRARIEVTCDKHVSDIAGPVMTRIVRRAGPRPT